MLLPILVSERWFSAVLLQVEPFKVLDSIYISRVRIQSKFDKYLTKKKINEYLQKELHSEDYDVASAKRVFIFLDENANLPFTPDYFAKDIVSKGTATVYSSNYFNHLKLDSADDETKSRYLNYMHYGVTPDKELRELIDEAHFESPMYLHNGEDVILSVNQVNEENRMEYLENVLEYVLRTLPETGIFKFTLDDSFLYIPLIAGLIELKQKLKDYFETSPLNSDLKIIRAPGLEEVKIKRDGEEVEVMKMKKDEMNYIDVKPDSKVHLELKSKKYKFKGDIYGSNGGIAIDLR